MTGPGRGGERMDEVEAEPAPPGAAPRARPRWPLMAVIAVAVIVVDQLSKWWAVETLTTRVIPVVWTLQLELAYNKGTAFSFGRGNTYTRFLPVLVLVVVGVVAWTSRRSMTKLGAVALGLVIGGALGNIIDRAARAGEGDFFTGGVVDFINFQWWPVFNVADMGVVIGGLLLVVVSLRADRHERAGTGGDADDAVVPGDGS